MTRKKTTRQVDEKNVNDSFAKSYNVTDPPVNK